MLFGRPVSNPVTAGTDHYKTVINAPFFERERRENLSLIGSKEYDPRGQFAG